jgi:GMP synthase (glutamine-hydrolysing)
VLGICYGMQAVGYLLGGELVPAERREYGPADFLITSQGGLLDQVTPERDGHIRMWMSHGDTVMKPPPGFAALGTLRRARPCCETSSPPAAPPAIGR